jgi:hypothetical protein
MEYDFSNFLNVLSDVEAIPEEENSERDGAMYVLQLVCDFGDNITDEILSNISLEDIDRAIEEVQDFESTEISEGTLADMILVEYVKDNLNALKVERTSNSINLF